MTTELTVEELTDAFEYLDDLRLSGRTNMFAAASYIENELVWPRAEAREAAVAWRKTFDSTSTVQERVAQALPPQGDRNPEGQDRNGLGAEHESAGPRRGCAKTSGGIHD
jgi:hypothetical protein